MPVPAQRSPNDDVLRVREATDIVRLVGEHVALRPRGREYVGLCPFHDDHTPSMSVVPHKQIFHCFVCGEGGDVFTFAQKFLRIDFREALELLAERAGIQLTARTAPAGESGVSRADLARASQFAAEFFRVILRHEQHGAGARAVIDRRAISPEMVERFGIGAAPARWDGLLLSAQAKGAPAGPLAEAGLLKARDTGGYYDAFRNRLMFPIRDEGGRTIAFGGRRIDDADDPKYLNSADSRLFSKSATLFALPEALKEIRATRTAIITEGYTDAIACHQAGFTNAVATLGTAMTREHAAVLRRQCETVVLLFDGDEAGQRAGDRAVEVFFAEPLDVRVATLGGATDAKDPDELLKREGGAEVFRSVLERAPDLFAFRYARLRDRLAGAGPGAASRAVEEEVARLVELGLSELRPVLRERIISHLSRVAGVDRASIVRSIPAGRAGKRAAAAPAPAGPGASLMRRPLSPREHALGCALVDPGLVGALGAEAALVVDPGAYGSPLLGEIAQALGTWLDRGAVPALADLVRDVGPEAGAAAVALAERVDRETGGTHDRLRESFGQSMALVRMDESRRGLRASGPGDVASMIEARRAAYAASGADRRVLPRPGGG